MITSLEAYRDDNGRLEVEVKLDSGRSRVFVVREDDMYEGELTFTQLSVTETPSWRFTP